MSVLSSQCAKLRKLAGEISALLRANTDWLWKDSAKLADAVDALREAADTIEGLRDRLQTDVTGGTCENLIDPWNMHDPSEPDFECSECHASGHANGSIDGGEYLFCPRCGAKVRKAVGA